MNPQFVLVVIGRGRRVRGSPRPSSPDGSCRGSPPRSARRPPRPRSAARRAGPCRSSRANTTSPSAEEWTGSTARAIPACAIFATMAHSVLVRSASVIRHTSVVFSTGSPRRNVGGSISRVRSSFVVPMKLPSSAARAGQHLAVLADHVAERVHDGERSQLRALRQVLLGEADPGLDRELAAAQLADRRARAGADAAELGVLARRLACGLALVGPGPARRIAAHQVVDDGGRAPAARGRPGSRSRGRCARASA